MANLVSWICRCGETNWMTPELDRVLRRSQATFYCVHGHAGSWPVGETAEDKLRREVAQLRQNKAYLEDRIKEESERAERERHRANGYKGHATRMTKRAKAGVCPCCNRTFKQLARHMATQHPQFTPIEIDQVPQGATVQ